MSVEEILILVQIVVIANLQEALVRVTIPELPQARPGEPIQSSPQDFVVKAPHVDLNSPRARFASDNVHRFWRKRKRRPGRLPVQARWSLFCHFWTGQNHRARVLREVSWSRIPLEQACPWQLGKKTRTFSHSQFFYSAAWPAGSLSCYKRRCH